MKQDHTDEAATIALEELKAIRAGFTADTDPAERAKMANACIRLAQCTTRQPVAVPRLTETVDRDNGAAGGVVPPASPHH